MTRRTPFDVEAQEIGLLGPGFAEFVNSLLDAETAKAGLSGEQLRTDSRNNVADGGVDSHLVSSIRTRWLPAGDTAWQFKSGDLPPAKCKTELRGATWAKDLLEKGASYRLVLGAALSGDQINRRRNALSSTATESGLLDRGEEHRVQVLDANQLARWSSEFPAISQSRMLRGMAPQVMPFLLWSHSQRHQSSWVGHEARDALLDAIREEVAGGDPLDLRVAGPSGVGKTRLVMEALRHEDFAPLVAYIRDAEGLDASVMAMLAAGDYHGVLVVDECTPKTHERLADQLRHDSDLRLLTLGLHQEERSYPLRCPTWIVPGMPAEALDEFLKTNHAGLSPEARRLVTDHVAGSVRYAAVLAERILNTEAATVAELVKSGDLTELLALELPEGDGFFFSQALALVERFGFEGGLEEEVRAIAAFAGASEEQLRAVVQQLEERGLVETHGRYRAVAPDPLATYLAAHAWQTWSSRILDEFLPALHNAMRSSLFRRAASLGRYEPVRAQFVRLLENRELFGSLRSMEERDTSELLLHLAVIAPHETMVHIAAAVKEHSTSDLNAMTRSRRNFVWALERLVWHSTTFESAADVLLHLSLAENESFANNATGVWLALFGTMLPATAASPGQRLRYLQAKVTSSDQNARALLVRACAAGLEWHESVMVSGELQGGTVVERRGTPFTWGDAADYRVALAEVLRELCDDSVEGVAQAALESLVATLHPFADDQLIWPRLKPIFLSLDTLGLASVRSEADHFLQLHERVRAGDDEDRRPGIVSCLTDLLGDLPQPTQQERLASLAGRSPWDFWDDAGARRKLTEAVVRRVETDGLSAFVQWVVEEEPPSAWYIGQGLAEVPEHETETALLELTGTLPATELVLAGYLAAADEKSTVAVFDNFLDEGLGAELERELRLRLTVRGPITEEATERVERLVRSSSVLPSVLALMPWASRLPDETSRLLLRTWTQRLSTQEEYNAVIDWVGLWLHRREEIGAEPMSTLADLLRRRRDFPEMGQASWDWSQLASHLSVVDAVPLAELLLELVSSGHLMLPHREEARVLLEAAKAKPDAVWGLVGEYLEAGDYRVEMSLRGFFLHAIPLDVIRGWVGRSTSRAELVADIAPVGEDGPSPYADYLLTEFGESDRVAGGLAGELLSGTWVGPWSNRIRTKIEQMNEWLQEESHSPGVKEWARTTKASLEQQLEEAIRREAEEHL